MRIITDPITDSVLYLLNRFFFPIILRALRSISWVAIWTTITFLNTIIGPEPVQKLTEYVGPLVRPCFYFFILPTFSLIFRAFLP